MINVVWSHSTQVQLYALNARCVSMLKAAALLEKDVSESCETAVDAFHSLARYVDAQYQSIVDHVNSSAFEAKQEHIRMARNDTEQLKKIGQTARYDTKIIFSACHIFVRHVFHVLSSSRI